MSKDKFYSYKFKCVHCGGQRLHVYENINVLSKMKSIDICQKIKCVDMQTKKAKSDVIDTTYACAHCGKRWRDISELLDDASLRRRGSK